MDYYLFDMLMCIGWTIVYLLIITCLLKYNFLLISPYEQAIISSFELSIFLEILLSGTMIIDYVSLSYLLWGGMEIVIIIISIYKKILKGQELLFYTLFLLSCIALMYYFVIQKEMFFFFSYFNTTLADIIWLFWFKRKDYPMKLSVLTLIIVKFLSNLLVIPVYAGTGNLVISFFSVLLPFIDVLFITEYWKKKRLFIE